MRPYFLALGAIALGSGLATATLSRPVAAAPPATVGNDTPSIATCLTDPPSKPMVTVGDAESKWWLTETPTPSPLPPFFYGGAPGCKNMWIGDFKVTHETKVRNGIMPVYAIGARTGKFDPTHAFSFSSLCDSPTETNCATAVAERNCRRVVVRSTFAWKKHGWSDFKVYSSSTQGYELDNINCLPNGYLHWSLAPVTYDYNAPGANGKTIGQNDGFWQVPAAGKEDVYRIAAEAFFVKDPISDTSHGQANAKALPIIAPAQYPASGNPITEQLPVQIGIRAN